MEDVERKILIPENFCELPEDQKETISNEMFQYLWGWKNKKHDKPISVNGEVYWLGQSPNGRTIRIFYTDEHRSIWWEQRSMGYRSPYEFHIFTNRFQYYRDYRKKHFQGLAYWLCDSWGEGVVVAKQRVEDWKVRRKELYPEKYREDATHEDKCEVA